MTEMKQRIIDSGMRPSKIAELMNIDRQHLNKIINSKVGHKFGLKNQQLFNEIMTKIEKAIR